MLGIKPRTGGLRQLLVSFWEACLKLQTLPYPPGIYIGSGDQDFASPAYTTNAAKVEQSP